MLDVLDLTLKGLKCIGLILENKIKAVMIKKNKHFLHARHLYNALQTVAG